MKANSVLLAILLIAAIADGVNAQAVKAREANAGVRTCTADLLRRTPRYDTSRVGELRGRYRWVSVDTLSTRKPLPPELIERLLKEGKPSPRQFVLRVTDPALRQARAGPPGSANRPVGPLWGVVLDGDSTGFSPADPQVEVRGTDEHFLIIDYEPRMIFDGGHTMELLPIDVLGKWGFGGYYDTQGDLIGVHDINGKLVPTFAGFYCAFRVEGQP